MIALKWFDNVERSEVEHVVSQLFVKSVCFNQCQWTSCIANIVYIIISILLYSDIIG